MKRTLLFFLIFSQGATILVAQFQKNGYSDSWLPKSYNYYDFNYSDSVFFDPIKFDVTYLKGRIHKLIEFDGIGDPVEKKIFTYKPDGTVTEEKFEFDINGGEVPKIKSEYRKIWFDWLPFTQLEMAFEKKWRFENSSQTMELIQDDTSVVHLENGRFGFVEFFSLQHPGGNRVLSSKKWINWDGDLGELLEVKYSSTGDSTVLHRYNVEKDANGKILNLIDLSHSSDFVIHIDSWLDEKLFLIKDYRVDLIGPGNELVPFSKTLIHSENNLFMELEEYLWDGTEFVLSLFERRALNSLTKDLVSSILEVPQSNVFIHDTLVTSLDSDGRVLEEVFLSSQNGTPYIPRWKKVYSGHVSSQKEFDQDYLPRVFPNPCSEKIHFEKSPGPWLLMNTQGQSVFQSSGGKLEEDIHQVPPGNYFLVFTGTGLSQQLIVE